MDRDDIKIRNAFVVDADGSIEERAFDNKWSPLVNSLENLRDELKRSQRQRHA